MSHQKTLKDYFNKNTNISFTASCDLYKQHTQLKQKSQIKSSLKAKRQNQKKQQRKQFINKIFTSKRKQILFKNNVSSALIPPSINFKNQIQRITQKFIPSQSKIIQLWTFLKQDIKLSSIISFDIIIQTLTFSVTIKLGEDQLQSKYALQSSLLIALNWKAINREFKVKKVNDIKLIIQNCMYSLTLNKSSLNSYAFICLGNFLQDQNFKNYLNQNYQIEKLYQITIQAHNLEDITFFTLNFLSMPGLIKNSLAQKIIQFLQFNYHFFLLNENQILYEQDEYFFLKLDYLQIIHKLSNAKMLSKQIKIKMYQRMAYMMGYYHHRKWKDQNYKDYIFGKRKYQIKYFQTFIQLYSIPVSKNCVIDNKFMQQIIKKCINLIEEDNTAIEQNQIWKEINQRNIIIWQLLKALCKNQQNNYSQLIKDVYQYVLKKIFDKKQVKYHNQYKLFLCEVDEQLQNSKKQNMAIFQYFADELEYQKDEISIKLILLKIQRMIKILKIKPNNYLINENLRYRIKVLSINQDQQVRECAQNIDLLLEQYQDLSKYEYDKAKTKTTQNTPKSEKKSVFTFNQ